MGLSLRDQLLQAGFTQSKPEPKPQPKPEARREHSSQQRRGGGPGQPQPQRRDGRPQTQQARRPEERKPEAPRPPREPKPGGEPSLAHAYQIRAETEKREREEAQKRAQEEAARKREQRLKLAALVAGKAQNNPAGEHARNFFYGKKIRKVNVTPEQFQMLNAGELGVAQVDGRFMILSPELIREVLVLAPQHVALFVPEGIGASTNPDDDYSDPRFQVPDDLVW
ncbi:MAG: DUF2058 family protein [Rhodanobacteraceae bacterium]|nr:DUF2058 family protein [Rhodanobacteraceae bacterium]